MYIYIYYVGVRTITYNHPPSWIKHVNMFENGSLARKLLRPPTPQQAAAGLPAARTSVTTGWNGWNLLDGTMCTCSYPVGNMTLTFQFFWFTSFLWTTREPHRILRLYRKPPRCSHHFRQASLGAEVRVTTPPVASPIPWRNCALHLTWPRRFLGPVVITGFEHGGPQGWKGWKGKIKTMGEWW